MKISEAANLRGLVAAVINQAVWDFLNGEREWRRTRRHSYLEAMESAMEFLASPDLVIFTDFLNLSPVSIRKILDNPKQARKAFGGKDEAKVSEDSRAIAERKRARRRAEMYKHYQTQPRRVQGFTHTLDKSRTRG